MLRITHHVRLALAADKADANSPNDFQDKDLHVNPGAQQAHLKDTKSPADEADDELVETGNDLDYQAGGGM